MTASKNAPKATSSNIKSKSKPKSGPPKAKTEVKTHRPTPAARDKKKKQRVYTAEELGVPKLNGIVPTGVQKIRGKKKGKVFVDDADSMLAILGMVQAEKEGEVEGKIMKARQLEEIREAKRVEAERRSGVKKAKLEEVKDDIRQKKRRKHDEAKPDNDNQERREASRKSKRVSFG